MCSFDHHDLGRMRCKITFEVYARIATLITRCLRVTNMVELSPYERLGGEQAVRRLVDRFYDLMDTLPEAAGIRALHPEDLTDSREKLFMFLSGWLGGPPLYQMQYGHPRLRARHLPFPIGHGKGAGGNGHGYPTARPPATVPAQHRGSYA